MTGSVDVEKCREIKYATGQALKNIIQVQEK